MNASRRPSIRSAATLASSRVEVANVRYSKSGVVTESRLPNHDAKDFGPAVIDDSAWAILSVASNANSAPDDACLTSKMPGYRGFQRLAPEPSDNVSTHRVMSSHPSAAPCGPLIHIFKSRPTGTASTHATGKWFRPKSLFRIWMPTPTRSRMNAVNGRSPDREQFADNEPRMD